MPALPRRTVARRMGYHDTISNRRDDDTSTWTNGNYGPPLPPLPRKLALPFGGHLLVRRPERPFKAPVCCRVKARRIGFNQYRCQGSGHERIWPERWYHRALPKLFPF